MLKIHGRVIYSYIVFICMIFDGVNANSGKGLFDVLFSPCKCRCGVSNRDQKLLGGEYINSYEFPWLGLIQVKDAQTIPATLINNKYIVTAASQLVGITPYDIKVTLGQFDRCFPDVSSTNMSVEKIIIHPDFSHPNMAHDIALLKLSSPVQIDRRIAPICLAVPGNTYIGQVATITGWSNKKSREDSQESCKPKKLGLPVLGYEDCSKHLPLSKSFSKDKGCAGIVGVASVVCETDAGGPVAYRSYKGDYELIGIFTDNNQCNSQPDLATFTRINTEHLAWITENTKDACYCIKF